MPRVTIIQRVLPHYRISFVERLQTSLSARGIDMRLVYGQERAGTVPRTVALNRHWARRIENKYLQAGPIELVWQPGFAAAVDSDMVIVEQSSSLMLNYLLLARRAYSRGLLAFWGHGRNMQSQRPDGWRERIKKTFARHVDWWFAYTDTSRETVLRSGFPSERITVVNNAIDDSELRLGLAACEGIQQHEMAGSLGCASDNVALMCSGLHKDKRIEFLIEAAQRIRERLADFELIVIGDGPQRHLVERAASDHGWIHYFGARTGAERAKYFHAAKLLLMPGPVGLVVVDSFITARPLIATRLPSHGPEIAYLRSGFNGLMTAHDVDSYAQAVTLHLQDAQELLKLQRGCRESAATYSLSAMVDNFADGIERCLAERAGA
jgi:L-malate glycosyltransferase